MSLRADGLAGGTLNQPGRFALVEEALGTLCRAGHDRWRLFKDGSRYCLDCYDADGRTLILTAGGLVDMADADDGDSRKRKRTGLRQEVA